MNAYFQVCTRDGKPVVRFYPPVNGGEGLNREEVLEYLSLKNILINYNELAPLLEGFTEVTDIAADADLKYLEPEFVKVTIAQDNMTATVRMIAPYEGGPVMPKNEFVRELTSRGIIFGVETDTIDTFLERREYCTDIVVATGKAPKQGKDAEITYFFNTDPRVRPTLKEDGSVDFFNLNTINHCKEGELLAKLTPAIQGEMGMNVKGERIRPRDVRSAVLKFGHNISINSDKTEIYSDVNGHVSYIDGKVFVSNVLEVENVDNAVGNINYDGSVRINGNVCENFSVVAQGTIEVRGVVEGAYLEAGENIIIARGMNGMHKGVLKAKGNIISKFLENAQATAGGYVETESIIHSNVIAGTEVHVTGKRGMITGGKVSASTLISVRNLGSGMGSDTIVEVGIDASVKQKVANLQKEIVEINKQQATIVPVLEGAKQKLQQGMKLLPDQVQRIQQLAQINLKNSERLKACMEELDKYQDVIDCEKGGQIIVTGDVAPGTKICIGDASMVVKGAMKYCRFIKEAGLVKMAAIY